MLPDTALDRYCAAHSDPEPPHLAALRRETRLKTIHPQMLSGPYQGRLLSLLSHLVQPMHVLEIGTFTGYATLCLAEGLAPGGRVVTLEVNAEREALARKHWQASGFADRIELVIGDARTIIPTRTEVWDLVFLDARKEDYPAYYHLVLPRLRPGGLLLADNVLWSGQVADASYTDTATEALRAFNAQVAADTRVSRVLLPVRDGLTLIRVKN